jgi:very-short-patch-repair endonuclease
MNGQGCPICKESKGEILIREYLEKYKINYKSQFKFKDCKHKRKLPFDFYLPEYKICIEYDGIQHYKPIDYFGGESELNNTKIRDNIKNNYCKNNNINLIRIKYNDNITKKLNIIFNNLHNKY